MLQTIENINSTVNSFIWDVPAMRCIEFIFGEKVIKPLMVLWQYQT